MLSTYPQSSCLRDICKIKRFEDTIYKCKEIVKDIKNSQQLKHSFENLCNSNFEIRNLEPLNNEYLLEEGVPIYSLYENVSNILNQQFENLQLESSTLVLPAPTRWCSVYYMLRSLINLRTRLVCFASIDINIKKDTKDLINDVNLWKLAEGIYIIMKPIAEGIKKLEGDKPSISEVCKIIYDISNQITNWSFTYDSLLEEKRAIEKAFRERKKC